MLNFISNNQMRDADEHTVQNKGITSIDLMERACHAFVDKFIERVKIDEDVKVFCGKGNNGGDGLGIARLLRLKGYKKLEVYVLNSFRHESNDFKVNKERLMSLKIALYEINMFEDIPVKMNVVVDAVLGSGFIGTLEPFLAEVFSAINQRAKYIVSVDCPSGLDVEKPSVGQYQGIIAHKTISFQRPKFFFLFPESVVFTKTADFVPIGLDECFIRTIPSSYFWIEPCDVVSRLKLRGPFSHKGTYGHLLVIAGTENTMGASLLCGISALFSGAGLITSCIPKEYFSMINSNQPELMTLDEDGLKRVDFMKFDALAIGPGLGNGAGADEKVELVLKNNIPTVFDADALHILKEKKRLSKLPEQSILTPHMKEFDQLFGLHNSWECRLKTAKQKAQQLNCVIVLKNRYTFICNADGNVYINPTGNPSMAQGGMGDVLTGCIASFLAQGYSAVDAAIIGCYLHGKTGDELNAFYEVTPASMVAKQLSKTLKQLINDK